MGGSVNIASYNTLNNSYTSRYCGYVRFKAAASKTAYFGIKRSTDNYITIASTGTAYCSVYIRKNVSVLIFQESLVTSVADAYFVPYNN